MNRILKAIIDKLLKPCILFESKPTFSDNKKAVFDEMVRIGYNKKYRFIWYVSYNECAEIKNGKIYYWNPHNRSTLTEKIRNYNLYFMTKCIICCNSFLSSSGRNQITFGKNQISFYLSHGTPMKSVKSYYTSPGGIDYMFSAAPELNSLVSEEFSIPAERTIATGFPRNDVFSKPNMGLGLLFGKEYKKIIIWYPTYRQNAERSIDLPGDSLPIIHDKNSAELLNGVAKANNVLIVVKPHFAQDDTLLQKMELSNIVFINDEFFAEHDITSYEMLAGSDALITDYSSVYFDYTLCDKPIAAIWEDINSYKQFPGFAINLHDYLKGAEKVYQINELCDFISSVAKNEDHLQAERREIRDRVNISVDGQNSKRAVDVIVEKANL